MKAKNSSKRNMTVDHPDAADFVADPHTAKFLYPFIRQERSAGEAAESYGMSVNAMLYRIQRMQALGLVVQCAERTRAGRAVKLYRATADSFYVPLRSTSKVKLEELVTQWARSFEDAYARAFARRLQDVREEWGIRISREYDGRLIIAPAWQPESFFDYFQENAPTVIEGWFNDLRLDDEDAKNFQQDLMTLYFKYLGREGKRQYLMRVGLAPLGEGETLPTW
jgi:hypothetical protein